MSTGKPLVQDPISGLIREQDLRITAVHAIKEAHLFLVMLNHGRLEFPLDQYKRLSKATPVQLESYELMPDGAGVHWESLDEHLSLRGFLLSAMRDLVQPEPKAPSRTRKKTKAQV